MTTVNGYKNHCSFSNLLSRIKWQVSSIPNNRAICSSANSLSYFSLWSRAEHIAYQINKRISNLYTPIGLAIDRSPDMVAVMLGILLSGRPYVPLDIELPTYKLAAIIDLVAPNLILTDQRHEALISGFCETQACALLRIDKIVSETPSKTGVTTLTDEDIAYILFTSGSTGAPKGIEMRAGALGNLMEWQSSHPRLGVSACTLMSTPISFDVSFQEIFGCLATGGTLVLASALLRRDPVGLLRLIIEKDIERIYLPFVGVQQLAEAAVAIDTWPSALKDVVTAGEQLQITEAIVQLFSHMPNCVLHNHYGPAETHVVTTHELQGNPHSWPKLPPIGKPIANVVIHLLNNDGDLAETSGETAEIYIGGSCLAKGYLKQPTLTSEKFLLNPIGNGRLYRTSDLGRFNENGELEWIGRNDNQVKVRGHRVELGEVELLLDNYPAVRKAVVVPRKRQGTSEIIAYITADFESPELSETLLDSVGQWRDIWDGTYQEGDISTDPTFNIAGWNSSYTGDPIPEAEMREWAEGIVSRILDLKPKRVLEIGCGTGLLLFQISPRVDYYVGLDFSQQAISYVSKHLDKKPGLNDKVELYCRAAHELDGFEPGSFDTIVMNSVTQHFPSADYLLKVLVKANELLTPEGQMFVGDISSRPLRRTFVSAVEREKMTESNTVADLLSNIEQRVQLDADFSLDATYFELLPSVLPSIQSVEIQLKRGSYDNELINYRYDVILKRNSSSQLQVEEQTWATLPPDQQGYTSLIELVKKGQRISGIRNARLCNQWGAYYQLIDISPDTVLSALPKLKKLTAVDPEKLYICAENSGIKIELRPSLDPQCFNLALTGGHSEANFDSVSRMELARHASDPLLRRRSQEFIPGLRRYVKQHLPDYMQPAGYMLVTSFPTTPSGKVYRNALPSLNRQRPTLAQPYTAPKSQLECSIASVWRDVLDLDKIGLDDSFFDLGGNSLLSHQLSIRLSATLLKPVSTLQIFSHPNIRALAKLLDSTTKDQGKEIAEQARFRAEKQRSAYKGSRRASYQRGLLK